MLQRMIRAHQQIPVGKAIKQTGQLAALPLILVVLVGLLGLPARGQVSVLTQNADTQRDAVYSNENQLTPTSTIHKLFTMTLDNPAMGQALILGGVNVSGFPTNILLTVTSQNHNSGATTAWAFDADTGRQLWQLGLGTNAPFNTATPVLDPNLGPHGALFVITKDSATNTNKLHAIDALAGAELPGSPITISPSFNGVNFDSPQENARAALLDINGTIYVAFCHMTDSGTYHGWLIGYKYTNGSGFSQNGVWCDTCANGGNQGGLWGGGDGTIYDGTNIFVETGNGSIGNGDFGMSIVQISPSTLGTVTSSFLPPNAQTHSNSDQDLNGGGMVIMPGTGGKIFQGPSKYGSLYLVDSTHLGNAAINTYSTNSTIGHSPIAWNSGSAQYAYIWASGSALQQFCYAGGNTGSGPCKQSSFTGGGTLAISSTPTGGNAILWAFGGSELHAMNPADVSAPDYWNSNMSSGDATGAGGAFQYLAIANGKVYVPAGNTIIAYGSVNTCSTVPTAPSGLGATAASSNQVNLSWTASTTTCTGGVVYNIFRSTTSGFTPSSSNQIASGVNATTFSDTTAQPSTTYFYVVEGVNSAGSSPASNQASATTPSGCVPPAAPSGLAATATSSNLISLSWGAVTTTCTGGVTYNVFRSTTNGFTPSSSNQVASGVTTASFVDSGLTASTTYYYLVEAVDAGGASAASNQASATTLAPGSVCQRFAPGSVVAPPADLFSSGGTLTVNLTYKTDTDAAGRTVYCFTTSTGAESPTLHVNPGDHLTINLTDALPPATGGMTVNNPCGPASMMNASSVNLHYHGMTMPPTCQQDDVLHTLVNGGQNFTYNVTIPSDAPPGIYWYHQHVHMFSETSVLGGATGAIVVEGIPNVIPAVAGLPTQILLVRDNALAATGGAGTPSKDLSLNYVAIDSPSETPAIIQMKAGEQQFWRVLNASADTPLDLQLVYDGVVQPLTVVALDGVPTGSEDGTVQGTAITKQDILLSPAGRAEFIMTGPTASVANASLITLAVDTGVSGDSAPQRTLANIQLSTTATSPVQPAAGTLGGTPLGNLAAMTPDATRSLYFSESSPDFFITVNGATPTAFNPNNPPAIVTTQGSIEDWTVENRTTEVHDFHIHQIHFLLMQRDGVAVSSDDQQFMDTVHIPAWTGSGPYPNVTVRMDFRGLDVGDFVYHCHILSHEDNGMMAIIRVIPPVQVNAGGPAVAPFVADTDFSGGATINHANTIDLSGVTNPAPMAVYQTARVTATVGAGTTFSYTIPGFVPGSSQLVRLHFAETFHTGVGQRVFNISINGTQVQANFDIFQAANAMNKAVIKEYTANADANGNYTILFTTVTDKALVSGIEVLAGEMSTTCTSPSTPTNLAATAVSSSQINLTWGASSSSCTPTYNVYRSTTSGFTPSSANLVASGLTTTSFSDNGLSASTTYYYLVVAVTSGGMSAASNQANATTQPAACGGAPTTPTGLSATAASATAINLSWTASTAPANCTITYSVTRNGASAASGLTGTTFGDTGLTCNTAYTYTVTAADAFGSSAASSPASATTSACPTIVQINAGGPAVAPFVADVDFTGGATINHANTINLNGQPNPAPAAVYQTARVAATAGAGTTFSYTIPGYTAGSSHTVRLHFCETFWTAIGQRVFNVSINGTQVLANFDIFKTAGGQNRALIQSFTANANSSGQYVIVFTSVTDKGLISGIEVQ
jgi:FtsP/CotA-like multicopper oxidase with cupredoxin domain/fibronectin type 3 domain-containing protein